MTARSSCSGPVPKKSLGQHFLSDPRILHRIRAALPAPAGARVLEIGPGRGALTRELLAAGFRVTGIERDRDLVPMLRSRFPDLSLVEGDALEVDWVASLGADPGAWYLIGNIPYNITSPLIDRALETDPLPESIVYLVQKEVALRLAAEPGTAEYGALTVGVQAAARVERLFTVPAGAFQPVPKVDSAVVRLTPKPADLRPPDARRFRRIVVGLFGARRKQLVRGMQTGLGCSAEAARRVVERAGLDPARRPETFSGAEFRRVELAVVDEGWDAG